VKIDNSYSDWFLKLFSLSPPLKEGDVVNLLGQDFVMREGILRGPSYHSSSQKQTEDAFGFKWNRRESYEEGAPEEAARKWLIDRYGDLSQQDWLAEHGDLPVLLDAGCGACFSTLALFGPLLSKVRYLGVDISQATDVGQKRLVERGLDGAFMQIDLMHLPFEPSSIDIIYSEGVLHHTDSTEKAVKFLATLLKPNGRFMFYVYRRKGPIREFTDDLIREKLQTLSSQAAWDALVPLTKLGKALGELELELDIPEAVDFLEIPAGPIDIQRFVYWNVFKAFYRPNWTIEEMNHVNFDWYVPRNCHRQSPEEVRTWCKEAGLTISREVVEEAGITITARKTIA